MPPADVLIRTRGGGFIVVRGKEKVISGLYKGIDSCNYIFPDKVRQVFLAISTLLLMTSVIMFSNSSEKMQIAVGAVYFILNILCWGLALLVDPSGVWDMRRYRIVHTRTVLLLKLIRKCYGWLFWRPGRLTGWGGQT